MSDGDIIELTNSFVANSTDVAGGTIDVSGAKTITIKAKDGENVTISRKEGDTNFPMFKTSNPLAGIILGEGMTLSGSKETCSGEKMSVSDIKTIQGTKTLTDPDFVKSSVFKLYNDTGYLAVSDGILGTGVTENGASTFVSNKDSNSNFRLSINGNNVGYKGGGLFGAPANDVPEEVIEALMSWSDKLPDEVRKTKTR